MRAAANDNQERTRRERGRPSSTLARLKRPPAEIALQAGLVLALGLVAYACGDTSGDTATSPTPAPTISATTEDSVAPSTTEPVAPLDVTGADFVNLNDLIRVRGFFVGNLLGDVEATVAVAESPDGGTYPVGSVIQLVPFEAMVKREPGFSSATNDWEFFELDASEQGATIRVRGGDEVVNQFGGSCAACHSKAEPQWDFVCEGDHGCDPLPIGRDVIEAVQASDPRPRLSSLDE